MGNIIFGGSRSIPVTLENDEEILETNTLYLDGKEEHRASNSSVLEMLYNIRSRASKNLSEKNKKWLEALLKKLSKYNPQKKVVVNTDYNLCESFRKCENYTVSDLRNEIDSLLKTHDAYKTSRKYIVL
uniref:Uncharacterized protein n=1 Tax=viral metagenome TaxID=1070528 RepID=A0A6C0D1C9_9ZZZZ